MIEENISENITELAKNIILKTGKPKSIFQLVIIASLRHGQLNKGAYPRVIVPLKTKKTRIAIDEVNQGLIIYHSTN